MYFLLIFLLFFRHFSCSNTTLSHYHNSGDWHKTLIFVIFTNLISSELHAFTMTNSRYKVVAFRPAARLHVHYPQTSINSTISVTQSGPALETVDPTPPYPVNGHHRLGNRDLFYIITSVASCKTAVTPVCKQWSYHSFTLNHWYDISYNYVKVLMMRF